MSGEGEEQENRLFSRKVKKDQERIAKKFKVITPAEFEAGNSSHSNTGPKEGRPAEDSWACSNTVTNTTVPSSNEAANGGLFANKNDKVQN